MPSGKNDKSAKALKAVKRKSSGPKSKGLQTGINIPWLGIGAIVSVIALIAIIAFAVLPSYQDSREIDSWSPSADNPDPSRDIEGITIVEELSNIHVRAGQRVAYDHTPPVGGPHDEAWATCNGIVYDEPIRTENAVHSIEHGAVWITYEPDLADEADIERLRNRVSGQTYMFLSPFPGQESPISMQSWGRQLRLDSAEDPRINHFIGALRLHPTLSPEPGESCATVPGLFEPDNPNPFDPSPLGPDAVQMDGSGAAPQLDDLSQIPGLEDLDLSELDLEGDFPMDAEDPAFEEPAE
ncbi:DUF3105 domain-containing protein [Hoyosella rhizosphaerae]|uniref:DUF3105 domain-containing protein n=1 Tax=Hoyosella rhizosphaerae TaxID=1755582 RepID=A0A916UE99_9ACTN|nr:DUF3105 domain-containing protein [Hoyosella rhizosphaerae]MBN4927852.1 DUF3105 domain-containing protein [Hoyosella rhizosphaerae]GGC70476.1 hypothetical protein GCM10011410_24150 [Hoyosella rhizosphaerae]